MSFALLAVICLIALAGPLLALPRWLQLPVVVGELIVGIIMGTTGLRLISAADPTLSFLAQIGFVLVMFVAGTHVPLREPALRSGLVRGAGRALLIAVVAVPVGLGLAHLFGNDHGLLYAVLLASSSAAVILPALGQTPLDRPPLSELVPQIALADAACIVLLPLALQPQRAGWAALGALAVLAAATVLWWLFRAFERSGARREVHTISQERKLAIELRLVLAALFGVAAVAVATHVSIMLAGFASGLAVTAVGEPRRVAKQILALTEGFFSPIFFVWLGASLNLRDLASHPDMILLGLALGLSALAVHSVTRLRGQPLSVAALSAAQLGVPVGAAALGHSLGVMAPGEPAALLLGALITIAATAVLARKVTAAS